jgi:carboxypeptidase Taq
MTAYERLETHFKKIYRLSSAQAILGWDASTMMPDGSNEVRAEQLATLEGMAHEMLVDPHMKDWFAEAGRKKLPDAWQQRNLELMRRDWLHATAVDQALVEALSKARNLCEHAWRKLRQENNFRDYLPMQQKVLDLVREVAAQKASAFGCSRYDALLDAYDPGRTSAEIDAVFSKLKGFLPGFLTQALEKEKKKPAFRPLPGPFPVETQKNLALTFMKALGFDFSRGRVDISPHPFCGGVYDDVRITTRYNVNDFTQALMGILHETGHALYEFGLPKAWYDLPVGHALGMTIHESQSLLIEMQVCRSMEFIGYAAPLIRQAFSGKGDGWNPENLYRAYVQVKPGLIRVDADEVTYPAHIILRYELERRLVEGEMEFKDVPGEWKKGMKQLLGLDVPNDKDGCMQDVHWPGGDFGYFPCYTLGAMHAAQFFDAAKQQNPGIVPGIGRGNFAPLVQWLKENIHSQGSRLTSGELLKKVTGKPLDVTVYQEHLKRRYLA